MVGTQGGMSPAGTMTSEAKRALARTIRGLRASLIEDLGEALERAYRLSIDGKKAQLDEVHRVKRARLEGCTEIQGYIYGRPAPSRHDVARVDALGGTSVAPPGGGQLSAAATR